jgi:periplasmic divalent cation tolerance protein
MERNESGSRFVVVLTTAASEEVAARLADALVSRRLAACVNVVPGIVSTYRWEGKVATDPERLLLIKTTTARLGQVETLIGELHDYDLPEVIVLPVLGGSEAYLGWIEASTAEGAP